MYQLRVVTSNTLFASVTRLSNQIAILSAGDDKKGPDANTEEGQQVAEGEGKFGRQTEDEQGR